MMNPRTPLAGQYRAQRAFRRWAEVLAMCPPLAGRRVLDLGCGPGDLARVLAEHGARVTGVDRDPRLIAEARADAAEGCAFELADLAAFEPTPDAFDGLWCTFVAAYFPGLDEALVRWTRGLRDEAFACLVEIDDMFGHEPLAPRWQEALAAFYEDARRANLYEFRAGARLEPALRALGFATAARVLDDDELSFRGAAKPDVLAAWEARFARMPRLAGFLGDDHAAFVTDFLTCLAHDEHESRCRVVAVVGTRGDQARRGRPRP
ncbi:Methyltransferase domain-containing protein [Nannocystis exedens]|uniref:Methyltransferase domain-containing protein n=1 Tax=Nannocystis exedens TaxID=54 RepID=A0A1I2CBB5_9BACT|nr:class I SAM-dependent methyltransferase [Nannocystis exedens]PCC68405.1 Malonyl-[acyl-carrier protein] O-methyltransferase [Nannocystis exedens]SFE65554.1 Methyltransferase domain-containing protein [Nannocystis exedens]